MYKFRWIKIIFFLVLLKQSGHYLWIFEINATKKLYYHHSIHKRHGLHVLWKCTPIREVCKNHLFVICLWATGERGRLSIFCRSVNQKREKSLHYFFRSLRYFFFFSLGSGDRHPEICRTETTDEQMLFCTPP